MCLYDDTKEAILFSAPEASVLIVDDIITNRIVAESFFDLFELQIFTCKSGREAIDMVKSNRYDIVFMDHIMPDMDGITAAQAIRALESGDGFFQHLPIIALTGNTFSGMDDMFTGNGMNGYLDKPLDLKKLAAVLEKWIPKEKIQGQTKSKGKGSGKININIKGLDIISGTALSGGPESYIKVLTAFCRDGFEKISEIKNTLQKQDFLLYAVYLHALKSASITIGTKPLSERAQALSYAGAREDKQFIEEHNHDFIIDLESLLYRIWNYLNQEASADELGNIDFLHENLLILKAALEKLDIFVINSTLRELCAKRWQHEVHRELEQVDSFVLTADFDLAISRVEKLLTT